jgi:hypothetical protein
MKNPFSGISMALLAQNLKLYSIQAIAFLAAMNSFYAFLLANAPGTAAFIPVWFIWLLNMGALIYGYIGRQIPQPDVMNKIRMLQL